MFDLENGVAMGDAPTNSDTALFLKTSNGGENWNVMDNNKPIFGSGDVWRRLDFISSDIGYFSEKWGGRENQGISKTNDGGNNWNVVGADIGVDIIKFYNEDIGLATKGNSLFFTTDGGFTWKEKESTSLDGGNDIEFLPNNPSYVWFVDGWQHHIFYSNDTGKTWISQTSPVTDLVGRDIVFTDENNGWILSDNGILLHTNNNGGKITDVKEEIPSSLPANFELSQNYPNPFNPATTIGYSIPLSKGVGDLLKNSLSAFGVVTLKIYNVLGKEVTTLVNEVKPSGNYTIEFKAVNLPSGVYYYQLKTENFIQTKKMILLK